MASKRSGGDEGRRYDRLALVLGGLFTALGLFGIVLSLVIDNPAGAAGNLVWLVIGVVGLVVGFRGKRPSKPDDRPST